ncbi:MAG: hypothetical protein BGO11_02075 [Solirubrobacterales bacterium 70-9]|nr:MAG: hypothetical protein BGO11_02075 [Solirubrobacterales bacterium 70-9]
MVRTEADELKEAKYREIRDAELDHASGKLSDEDYAILDAELRKEAVEILDAVGVGAGTAAPRPGRAGLPSDWEGAEKTTGAANGNGANGTVTVEAPSNGNGHHANGPDDASGIGNGIGNGNGNGATHEPVERD